MEKLNNTNFDTFTKEGVCVIDFFANWCMPCKMLTPILEEVASEITSVKFAKIDVDETVDIAIKYGVDAIPALFILKDGQVVDKSVGLVTKNELKTLIEKHI